jgi:hypothetical protein
MLNLLSRGENHRKDRLFLVACCRSVWPLLVHPESRNAVGVAERHADGEASWEELEAAREKLQVARGNLENDSEHLALDAVYVASYVWQGLHLRPICILQQPTREAPPRGSHLSWQGLDIETGGLTAWFAGVSAATDDAVREKAGAAQAALLRCLFGNPFRPLPPVDPALLAWNNGAVKRLAEAAYEHRSLPEGALDVACLAVLADALEEAGVTDEAILRHCRAQGALHVRGCFVIDWLTGRG